MPRLIVAGEAGETYRNTTGRIFYQLIVNWSNSCGLCVQYDHQIGPFWPTPFHRGCLCKQIPIAPEMTARPFVDFREKIREVSPGQQAVIVGRANLSLIESGIVEWSDVVTTGRVRSLREVVSRKKLSVAAMTDAGVNRRWADEAYNAVHTATHTASEARRKQLADNLLAKGYTRSQVVDAAGKSLGSRVAIVAGPSGPSSLVLPSVTPKPGPIRLRAAALPAQTPPAPSVQPARRSRAGRLRLGTEAVFRFLTDLVRKMSDRFKHDYRGPGDD